MYLTGEDETPVFPFEYDHLSLYSEAEYYSDSEDKGDHVVEDLYNHDTYKYL